MGEIQAAIEKKLKLKMISHIFFPLRKGIAALLNWKWILNLLLMLHTKIQGWRARWLVLIIFLAYLEETLSHCYFYFFHYNSDCAIWSLLDAWTIEYIISFPSTCIIH